MNEQPEALRLADAMLNYFDERGPCAEAVAAELRRLHEANEEFGRRQTWWNDRMFEMEAALRQAVEALDGHSWEQVHAATIVAKQALGEQEDNCWNPRCQFDEVCKTPRACGVAGEQE